MTEKSEKTVQYRFSSTQILKVFAFVSALILINLTAAIIVLIRVWPFGITKETCTVVVITWLPAIIALICGKMWWDFARSLEGAKELRNAKTIGFNLLMTGMLTFVNATVFWQTNDIRMILNNILFVYLLFGSNAVFTIFEVYSNYRREYPQRTIDFQAYCNLTRIIN